MSYFKLVEESHPLAGPGCGSACQCSRCRQTPTLAGFDAAVNATHPRTGQACTAEERRFGRIIEPAAADVVTIDARHAAGGRVQLHRAAYEAYQRLKAAAEADGIPANVLTIVSGYRSVVTQRRLWEKALGKYGSPAEARRWVAPPGNSPHHTGRAIDFHLGSRNNSENVPALRRTGAYRWLVCHAVRFGFTPYAAEPWHWEHNPPAVAAAAGGQPADAAIRGAGSLNGLGSFGEPTHPALSGLIPLSAPTTAATVVNALAIVRLISQFHSIPFRIPFVTLEHEGGVRLFGHHDGVMQTTDAAKPGAIRAMPRELKLSVTGRPFNDPVADTNLNAAVQAEFPHRLAVQIACGVQELKNRLNGFSNYVALAYIAYNAGSGNSAWVVTRGTAKSRPRGTTDDLWESMCRFGASLYHQLPPELRIETGQWQCDANIPAWFRRYAVFDRQSGQQLIAYQYLRSIQACIRPQRPTIPCTRAVHGGKHRQDGTGEPVCNPTRPGALDKFYNPALLDRSYRDAVAGLLAPIPEDNLPIKIMNGRLVKMPLASGQVAPQGSQFDGFTY